jgi:hypothetical protein
MPRSDAPATNPEASVSLDALPSTADGTPANGDDRQPDQSVKLDAMHVLLRLEKGFTSTVDPLVGCFQSMMAAAIFLLHPADVQLTKQWLREHRNLSAEEVNRVPRKYFIRSRSVRNSIAQPKVRALATLRVHTARKSIDTGLIHREIKPVSFWGALTSFALPDVLYSATHAQELAARMLCVFDAFKGAVMADGRPLYREDSSSKKNGMRQVFAKVMEHVYKGCVSDSPGVELFAKIGEMTGGLPIYRCSRGTSPLEVRPG